MEVLNFDLLKHPMNWVTIVLMLLIFGVAFNLVATWIGNRNATKQPS